MPLCPELKLNGASAAMFEFMTDPYRLNPTAHSIARRLVTRAEKRFKPIEYLTDQLIEEVDEDLFNLNDDILALGVYGPLIDDFMCRARRQIDYFAVAAALIATKDQWKKR